MDPFSRILYRRHVRLYKGEAFRLTLDDFSFTFDEATDTSASCEELGYTGSVQGGSGYVSVVAPGGESNNIACRFSV